MEAVQAPNDLIKQRYEASAAAISNRISKSQRTRNIGSIALGLLSAGCLAGGAFLIARSNLNGGVFENRGMFLGGAFTTIVGGLTPLFFIPLIQITKPNEKTRIDKMHSLLGDHDKDFAYYALEQNRNTFHVMSQLGLLLKILSDESTSADLCKKLNFDFVCEKLNENPDQNKNSISMLVEAIITNKIKLKEQNFEAYDKVLKALGTHIQHLYIRGVEKNFDQASDLQYFPNLQRLCLTPSEFADFNAIPGQATSVTLDVTLLFGKQQPENYAKKDKVTTLVLKELGDDDARIRWILQSFPNVKHIELNFNNPVSIKLFNQVCIELIKCDKLESIIFKMKPHEFDPISIAAVHFSNCKDHPTYLDGQLTVTLNPKNPAQNS